MLILSLKDSAIAAIRSLCALLCEAIYPIIAFAYELFIKLATFELLEPTAVKEIYKRITMILTIIMVFYITFEFVKYVIQPETMTDKEKGVSKLPIKTVAVVVLIALIPNFFTYANKLQTALIKNEIVSKIILNKSYINYEYFGRNLSWQTLNVFYHEEIEDEEQECEDGIPCNTIIKMNESNMLNDGKLTYMALGINSAGEIKKNVQNSDGTSSTESLETTYIHFDAIWAVLVGGFIAYMLILYCVDVGARVIQIAYLQIIAPIPIIGILSPKKDNMFTKWAKQCLTTYLDVFIRLAIINFILLICQTLLNSTATENFGGAEPMVKIALILGLLVFAKRVPKMIGELFPKTGAAGGNFGLKAGDRNLGRVLGAALGITAGTAAGLATGIAQGARKAGSVEGKGRKLLAGTTGVLTGAVRGSVGGFGRGLWNGAKKGNVLKNATVGAKNQIKSNQQFGNRAEAGYGVLQQIGDTVRHTAGLASRKQEIENSKAPIKRQNDAYAKIKKTNEDIRNRAESKIKEGKGRMSGQLAAAEKVVRDFKEDPTVKSRYAVGKYKTDAEAQDAYNQAVDAARTGVQRRDFIDRMGRFHSEDYNKAVQAAVNGVNKDNYKAGYATQAEADAAFERDYQQAQLDLKEMKDRAIDDYIDNGDITGKKDDAINAMVETMNTEIREYNKYSAQSYSIDTSAIPTSAHAFDDYVKKDVKKIQDTNERTIISKDAEIAAIERQTSGSGIGENKK